MRYRVAPDSTCWISACTISAIKLSTNACVVWVHPANALRFSDDVASVAGRRSTGSAVGAHERSQRRRIALKREMPHRKLPRAGSLAHDKFGIGQIDIRYLPHPE